VGQRENNEGPELVLNCDVEMGIYLNCDLLKCAEKVIIKLSFFFVVCFFLGNFPLFAEMS